MHRFVEGSELEVPVDALAAWHGRPGAAPRLVPPWERMELVAEADPSRAGSRARIRLGVGPFSLDWVSEVRDLPGERGFRDVQVDGPFARWTHDHVFHDVDASRSRIEDRIEYELPMGAPGRLVAGRAVERRLERIFAYRHRILREDLLAHQRCSSEASGSWPLTVAVTGSSGLVGSALVPYLRTGGHRVLRLVRGEPASRHEVAWDPTSGLPDPRSLEQVDAVVHLAGESVAARWTESKKRRIRRSRVRGTRELAEGLASLEQPPRVFLSASAVGVYGDRGEERLDEDSSPGSGFLAEVVRGWEAAADPLRRAGTRVVNLRFGMVLSPAGGALATMLPAFRAGLGGPLGSGRQWVSWVSVDDVLDVILHTLASEEMREAVNVVAPVAVRNRELAKTLGRVLSRPAFLRIPAWALRAAAGRLADEMLLASARVEPGALRRVGHRFREPELEGALRHVLGRR